MKDASYSVGRVVETAREIFQSLVGFSVDCDSYGWSKTLVLLTY
jgi:hypothetical protein